MSTAHVVKQGETLHSIAARYGFRDWHAIWEHPDNSKIREIRRSPQILREGDEVLIPDKNVRKFLCGTRLTHRFMLRAKPAVLRLVLKDEEGIALEDHKYVLEVNKQSVEGRTGPGGLIDQEVPPDATEGRLTLWLGAPDDDEHTFTWTVRIGHLDPHDTVSGVQGRLNNLGFDAGPVTGEMNAQTRDALRRFQAAIGYKEPPGEIDEATRLALEESHEHVEKR